MRHTLWVPDDPSVAGLNGRLPAEFRIRGYRPGEPMELPAPADLVVVPYASPVMARQVLRPLRPGTVVQSLEAGVDALLPALPPGVTLCRARGVHDAAVAEWVTAAVLSSLRRFPEYRDNQRTAHWRPALSEDLTGKRVLLLGHGAVGQAVEQRLAGFGVRFTRVARRPRPGVHAVAALGDLLPEADVVIVLLPLTAETTGLLNRAMLSRLPDGALVVNAARGAVIATEALLDDLQAGRLRAVLDVTDPEPPPEGHPLWAAPNLLVTPHVAADTTSLLTRAYTLVAEQARRMAAGEEPLHVVDGLY